MAPTPGDACLQVQSSTGGTCPKSTTWKNNWKILALKYFVSFRYGLCGLNMWTEKYWLSLPLQIKHTRKHISIYPQAPGKDEVETFHGCWGLKWELECFMWKKNWRIVIIHSLHFFLMSLIKMSTQVFFLNYDYKSVNKMFNSSEFKTNTEF